MATCKDCQHEITWAATNGHTLPFEKAVAGLGGETEIYKFHGTRRARPHRGHPHVPRYRPHRCKRRNS